jgi:hypothetical protein
MLVETGPRLRFALTPLSLSPLSKMRKKPSYVGSGLGERGGGLGVLSSLISTSDCARALQRLNLGIGGGWWKKKEKKEEKEKRKKEEK